MWVSTGCSGSPMYHWAPAGNREVSASSQGLYSLDAEDELPEQLQLLQLWQASSNCIIQHSKGAGH